MSGELRVVNRQRDRKVDTRLLRQVIRPMLEDFLQLQDFDITIRLLGDRAMATLNQKHLQHEGPTDVITLDYSDSSTPGIVGEINICIAEAVRQARRFRTTWQSELIRYVIHGILHLQGHDDLKPGPRRKMKREEANLLKAVGRNFH